MIRPFLFAILVLVALPLRAPGVLAQDTQGNGETAETDPVTGSGSISRRLSQRDPFAWQEAVERHTGGDRERALGEAMLQLVLDPAETSPHALHDWLTANAGEVDVSTRVFVTAMYGERLMEIGRHAEALAVFRQLSEAVPEAAANFENGIGILEQFGDAGPTLSVGANGATLPTTLDVATLLNIPVEINGQAVSMIADTGAEYTVLSASTAQALGIEAAGSGQTVGTAIMPELAAQFTILPELQIGAMRFENIATIVLPDSALTFSAADSPNLESDYQIHGILGLPVMVAAGRIAWLDGGRAIALGDDAPAVMDGAPVYWHRQGIGLAVDFGNGPAPVYFDSGSRVSQGSDRALLELGIEPESLEMQTITTGGGGGFAEENVRVLPALTFGLPGAAFTLEDANIYPARGDVALDDAGYAGADILKAMSVFAVDFETMRYRAEP